MKNKNLFMHIKKLSGMMLALAVLSAALLLAGCIQQQEKNTVSASGISTVTVEPDEAQVFASVETLEKSAEESKNKNAEIVEKIYAALYQEGIPREDIETQYFNIYEEFEWMQDGGRKSLGYKTSHNLKIITTDFSMVGNIIDAVVDAGATSIQNINFELSEQEQSRVKKLALEGASKDAKEKAEAIASGLDARLGRIVSVKTIDYSYFPYRAIAESLAADAVKAGAETEISPRQLEVSAQVEVVFEIR